LSRLVREAKLFDAKLGPIDGAGNVGKFLMQLAEGKPVAQPAAEAEPKKSGEKSVVEAAKEKGTEKEKEKDKDKEKEQEKEKGHGSAEA
jgi:vacuolar protein sorting-associated protein 54